MWMDKLKDIWCLFVDNFRFTDKYSTSRIWLNSQSIGSQLVLYSFHRVVLIAKSVFFEPN